MQDDFFDSFFGCEKDFVVVKEDIKEGLVQTSNVNSYDRIANSVIWGS